jgi:sec-independent protein translocase protein TatC
MPLDQPDDEDLSYGDPEDEFGDRDLLARMPLSDHLEDLRHRLIMALIGPAVAMVLTLFFGWRLVDWLVQPLLQVLDILGLPPQVYAFGVPTGFAVYIKVSLVAAVVISFPWIVYQLWKFVEAGLYKHEKKGIVLVAPFSAVMSALGVAFLYYLLLPVCLAFMLFFTTSFPSVDVQQQSGSSFLGTVVQIMAGSYGMSAPDLNTTAEGDTPPATQATQPAEDDPQATQPGDDGRVEALSQLVEAPILKRDPENPAAGQIWIKVPQRELRVHLDGQVYRFLPFQSRSMMQPMMDINQYLSFITWLALGVVIAFQLPVVMLILGWSGLVSPYWLGQYRKYCVFICFGLGAVFTPADPVSMLVLALPLWGLFELGLALMKLTYREPAEEDMLD